MKEIEVLEEGYVPLMERVVTWASDQEGVRALFISGSIAKGNADAFSDLDLVVIVPGDKIDTLMESARTLIDEAEPIIIEYSLGAGDRRILSIVTDQWHRMDFAFCTPGSGALNQTLVPVMDPDQLYEGPPTENPPAPAGADRIIGLSKEFLRILGLSVVVNGRKDVHVGHDGANLLRNLLIELFLLEPPLRTRPGTKKLLPVLTDEQQMILKALPPLADDLEILGAFNEAIASVFLPRARKLTESLGGTWPDATESATRTYLRRLEA